MEIFNTIVKQVVDFMGKIDFLKLGSPAAYIAVAGAVLVLIAFFIGLIAQSNSSVKKYRKDLQTATEGIKNLKVVDESNVSEVYECIKTLPETTQKGWSSFLAQQTGYPSDFIVEKDNIDEGKSKLNFVPGRGAYTIISFIVIALCAILSAMTCMDSLLASTWPEDTFGVITIIATIALPLVFYIIFVLVLNGIYRKEKTKLVTNFRAFQDAMDSVVVLFKEEEDEFVSENIDELNTAIEDIVANRLNNTEIIELVTAPKIEEDMLPVIEDEGPAKMPAPKVKFDKSVNAMDNPSKVEKKALVTKKEKKAPAIVETVEAEPVVEEVVASEAPAPLQNATAEEKGAMLVQLVRIVEAAVADKNNDQEGIDELTLLLKTYQKSGAYPSDDEQEIFDICLGILAQYKKSI